MNYTPSTIPFVKQENSSRCGAASLAMVYEALGMPSSQAEIWPAIKRKYGHGASTHLLAKHAMQRGFWALDLQVKEPWPFLLRCRYLGLFLIVNQQPRPGAGGRHFTVIVNVEEDRVVLHDPLTGPEVIKTKQEFLNLWKSSGWLVHGTGNIAVIVAPKGDDPVSCSECGEPLPASVSCFRCRETVHLRPSVALGCLDANCKEAAWKQVFCPHCDASILEKSQDRVFAGLCH